MALVKENDIDFDGVGELGIDEFLDGIADSIRESGNIEDYMYLRNLKQRKLYIDCDVSFRNVEDVVINIMNYNKSDKELPVEKRSPIYLYISSPGGEVAAGLSLINVISSSKTPVYTINIGNCYSMAFYIFISGHKRFALKDSTFLLHDGFNQLSSSFAKTQDVFEFQQKQEDRLKQYTISKTKITDDEYNSKYRTEWYMYPEDAKKLGVVDYIVGVDSELDEIV